MTSALREGGRETVAGPSPVRRVKPSVAPLSERRSTAERRLRTGGVDDRPSALRSRSECPPPVHHIQGELHAYHLLGWAEAIGEGERRGFEEWMEWN